VGARSSAIFGGVGKCGDVVLAFVVLMRVDGVGICVVVLIVLVC
jgi:hypothetical protein